MLMGDPVSWTTAGVLMLLSPPSQSWGRYCTYLSGSFSPVLYLNPWAGCWGMTTAQAISWPLAAKWSTQISYAWGSPFPNMPIVWSDPSHNWVVIENRRINVSALYRSLTFASSTPFEYHTAWKHSKLKRPYLCQSLGCHLSGLRARDCQNALSVCNTWVSSHATLSYLKIDYKEPCPAQLTMLNYPAYSVIKIAVSFVHIYLLFLFLILNCFNFPFSIFCNHKIAFRSRISSAQHLQM